MFIIILQVASIAGNLMIKNQHNWFGSDIYLLLETIGAQVTIRKCSILQTFVLITFLFNLLKIYILFLLENNMSGKQTMTMQQFLKVNMRGYVIWNIMMPPLCNSKRLVTFKVISLGSCRYVLCVYSVILHWIFKSIKYMFYCFYRLCLAPRIPMPL